MDPSNSNTKPFRFPKGQVSSKAASSEESEDGATAPTCSSMASSYPLVLLLLLAAATAAAAAAAADGGNATTPTAYEMLERYDFPRGILPAGVSGYELRADGSFEVYFPRRCDFLLAGKWLVRYETRVSGSVAAGSLTALEGISVKVLFLWLGVGEVDRSGDTLSFYIGPVATTFPLDDFAESPRCRGYDGDGFFLPAASS